MAGDTNPDDEWGDPPLDGEGSEGSVTETVGLILFISSFPMFGFILGGVVFGSTNLLWLAVPMVLLMVSSAIAAHHADDD